MIKHIVIKRTLIVLIVISFLIRLFVAAFTELGVDEVYYWTYALYPDWSYFDHPAMVGVFIRLFTFDLTFDSELALRMPSVLLGVVNTWLVFIIGNRLKNNLVGLYAAFLYNSSLYGFLITGVFILPDTPLTFFWLLAIFVLLRPITEKTITKRAGYALLAAGLWIGLAMLSKYHAAVLWLGAGLYILIYNRLWLRYRMLYLAVIISVIIFTPVIIWNMQHDFVSLGFHSERVGLLGAGIQYEYLLSELAGEIAYNNPINFVFIILALISLWRGKLSMKKEHARFLLLTSLPLILTFLFFSFFRRTLPHWSCPAYLSLIFFAAIFIYDNTEDKPYRLHRFIMPYPIRAAVILTLAITVVGFLQVRNGIFDKYVIKEKEPWRLGQNHVSLDMYGWKQLRQKFYPIMQRDLKSGNINPKSNCLVSNKWFPAAHLDYYVATPFHLKLFAIGTMKDIHQYNWINQERGNIQPGMDAWYLSPSTQYRDPDKCFPGCFEKTEVADTIQIMRSGRCVRNVFVFRMKNYLGKCL